MRTFRGDEHPAGQVVDVAEGLGLDLRRCAVFAVNLGQTFAAVEGMVGDGRQLAVQGDGREAFAACKGVVVDFGQGGGAVDFGLFDSVLKGTCSQLFYGRGDAYGLQPVTPGKRLVADGPYGRRYCD